MCFVFTWQHQSLLFLSFLFALTTQATLLLSSQMVPMARHFGSSGPFGSYPVDLSGLKPVVYLEPILGGSSQLVSS